MEFVLGGGCFWCVEAVFQEVVGVKSVVSGYGEGAEVVKIEFDPKVIPPEIVLDIYFISHDPTTVDRQGNDIGPQYRSIMFYADAEQKKLFEAAKERAEKVWDDPVVTEIIPLEAFTKADKKDQNFFKKHPEGAYCQVIIAPKLNKIRQQYTQWFTLNQT